MPNRIRYTHKISLIAITRILWKKMSSDWWTYFYEQPLVSDTCAKQVKAAVDDSAVGAPQIYRETYAHAGITRESQGMQSIEQNVFEPWSCSGVEVSDGIHLRSGWVPDGARWRLSCWLPWQDWLASILVVRGRKEQELCETTRKC